MVVELATCVQSRQVLAHCTWDADRILLHCKRFATVERNLRVWVSKDLKVTQTISFDVGMDRTKSNSENIILKRQLSE